MYYHKSSLNRFSKGQRGLCGQHLYEHFFEEGHSGLDLQRGKVFGLKIEYICTTGNINASLYILLVYVN